jgi:peptidoglycan-N-acetylglucosamine deacetylase
MLGIGGLPGKDWMMRLPTSIARSNVASALLALATATGAIALAASAIAQGRFARPELAAPAQEAQPAKAPVESSGTPNTESTLAQAAAQAAPADQPLLKPAAKPAAPARRTVAAPPAAAPANEAACGPSAIGLSRTVEIDATNGPRFGRQQYKENDFLKDGEIVLTFDDGPSSIYTPRVIEALTYHCTKATFYMVGSRALAETGLVKEIHRKGHTIGTHTWSHANLRNIGIERAKPEFELGFSGVQKALGKPIAPFFRFPYLADSRAMQEYARTRHMAMFSIDMDAYDYKTLQPVEVHKAIMRQVLEQRKGIILFHDIQPATAGALKNLLSDLKSKGFKVVHTVPKGRAETLSPYDLQANLQLAQKTMAAQSNPLVTRSPTWGRAGDAAALPGPGTAATTAPVPDPWRPTGQPPVATSGSGPGFPPATQPVQPPRRANDTEWHNRIFRN